MLSGKQLVYQCFDLHPGNKTAGFTCKRLDKVLLFCLFICVTQYQMFTSEVKSLCVTCWVICQWFITHPFSLLVLAGKTKWFCLHDSLDMMSSHSKYLHHTSASNIKPTNLDVISVKIKQKTYILLHYIEKLAVSSGSKISLQSLKVCFIGIWR